MIAEGWNSGSPNNTTGGGYGLRIPRDDRDRYFREEWSAVLVELDDGDLITVNLTPSFWRGCSELRGARIGRWLLEHNLAPWPKGNPPRLVLEPIGNARFRVRGGRRLRR